MLTNVTNISFCNNNGLSAAKSHLDKGKRPAVFREALITKTTSHVVNLELQLGADAGEFVAVFDVDDFELLGVHAGIGAER